MDEMRVGICHLTGIYAEFTGHDDPGYSITIVNEISKLQDFPTNSVLKRLCKSIRDRKVTKINEQSTNIYSILAMHKEKLADNYHGKEVVIELINGRRNYAQKLRNPFNMLFSEVSRGRGITCGLVFGNQRLHRRIKPSWNLIQFNQRLS